jgi:DNA polymerase III epsilon subunit-like protein
MTVPVVILDTESTGLDAPMRAVELAWIIIDDDMEVMAEHRYLTNPERSINPGAIAIHGITDEMVADAPSNAEVMAKLPGKVIVVGHNCLTGDHEVLTKSGWVRLDTLDTTPTLEAAVWSTEGKITFEVAGVVSKVYSGTMYEYDTIFHKGVYTPDHRVYNTKTRHLLKGGKPKWEVSSAKDMAGYGPNSVAIPSCGEYEAEVPLDFTPSEVRFLEMLRADASIEKANAVRLNLSKPRKIARCKELLQELEVPYSEALRTDGATRIAILACPLRDKAVNLLGTGKTKTLGPWVLQLSLESRKALLDETLYWDGAFTRKGENSKVQVSVTSASAKEMEWLQIAAVTSGFGSKIALDRPNNRGFSRSDGVLSTATIRPNNYVKTLVPPTERQHSGKVYCLSTSTGAFLVRREGVVWVTGNCSYDLRVIGEHIELLAGDLCTLALSRSHIKGTTNHKLATLQAELGLSKQESHTALGDCRTTLELLRYISKLTGKNLRQLIGAATVPKMVQKMPFGKHKGKAMVDVPVGYRRWLLEEGDDLHRDLRYTLERLKVV